MKQFQIYRDPRSHAFEAVKIGWSWPAFFCTTLWALINQLWVPFFVVFGCGFAFSIVMSIVSMILIIAVGDDELLIGLVLAGLWAIVFFGSIFVSIIFGKKGNQWRHQSLLSRGYEPIHIEVARNRGAAMIQARNKVMLSTHD